jgi:hypothetical protein
VQRLDREGAGGEITEEANLRLPAEPGADQVASRRLRCWKRLSSSKRTGELRHSKKDILGFIDLG